MGRRGVRGDTMKTDDVRRKNPLSGVRSRIGVVPSAGSSDGLPMRAYLGSFSDLSTFVDCLGPHDLNEVLVNLTTVELAGLHGDVGCQDLCRFALCHTNSLLVDSHTGSLMFGRIVCGTKPATCPNADVCSSNHMDSAICQQRSWNVLCRRTR